MNDRVFNLFSPTKCRPHKVLSGACGLGPEARGSLPYFGPPLGTAEKNLMKYK